MRRPTILLLLLPLLMIAPVAGCSSRPTVDRWVAAQGGTICDRRLDRARGLTAALIRPGRHPKLKIAVLDRDDLSAFSWPTGQIFVSRGLIDSLDDAALSAAIAHEIAHILDHGHSHEIAGLSGRKARLAGEVRADRLGVQLLQRAGVAGDAMGGMLERVLRNGGLAPQARADLRHRIMLIRHSQHID